MHDKASENASTLGLMANEQRVVLDLRSVLLTAIGLSETAESIVIRLLQSNSMGYKFVK